MKKLVTAFILLLVAEADGQITFQKLFGGASGDGGASVQQTIDGGNIVAGIIDSLAAGGLDFYLIKTNASGDTLWTKGFGGTAGDECYGVKQTPDGGYILMGNTYSYGAGNSDILIIKTDANGNSVWAKTFGGPIYDVGRAVDMTFDGGYVIAGHTDSYGSGGTDAYLIKIDSIGNLVWSKTYGGIGSDAAFSAQQTTDGGFILTGSTDFGLGNADVYLIKTDGNGNILWTKTYGNLNIDVGNFVRQTNDGGYIITGDIYNSILESNVYLIKIDSVGNVLWSKNMGGAGDDVGSCVNQTTDGGYIITGRACINVTQGDYNFYLIKTDAYGDSLWTKSLGGILPDYGYSVQQTFDGGYIAVGGVYLGSGGNDVYLIKTDANGKSGCNEVNKITNIYLPSTLVTIPATNVTSPSTIVTTPTVQEGKGGNVTTLCFSIDVIPISNSHFPISIFPNPTSGTFKINYTLAQNTKGTLQIVDITGKIIYIQTLMQWSTEQRISLTQLAGGIYSCVITSGDKREHGKLVVVK